jgi:hypothetical protein
VADAGRFTSALIVFGAFGLVYVGATHVTGIPEAAELVARIARRARR